MMDPQATTAVEFREFHKIPRYSREVLVSEKIDGTNASVFIGEDGTFLTGCRTRWITPDKDNHSFSRWAHEHMEELKTLGPGHHFGEWWGNGIQRGYGLKNGDKRFSLFNLTRWCLHGQEPQPINSSDPRNVRMQDVLPTCVGLVPLLWRGLFDDLDAKALLQDLAVGGSRAVPGYMNPEGIVVFHTAAGICFKKTVKQDDVPKSKAST